MTDTTQTEQQLQTETGKREIVTVTETGEVIAIADLIIRGVSPDEQETTIVMEHNSPRASIYVSDNVTLTKIKRILSNADTDWEITRIECCDGDIRSVFLSCPKKRIGLRSGNALSKEQRARLIDNLTAADDSEDDEEE